MVQNLLFILLGLAAGALSGLVGIGGGIIIVPALVFLFHLSQKNAQGTSLAVLLPPVGILAVMAYYKAGQIDVKIAGLICLGFVAGALLGSSVALNLPDVLLRRVFGGFIILVGLKMLLSK